MPSRLPRHRALPYSNNRLHVGHIAGAYLPADTYVRYLRATGCDVRFICGSDDNGVAIEISALRKKTTPQAIAQHYHDRQAADFAGLGIAFRRLRRLRTTPTSSSFTSASARSSSARIYDEGYFVRRAPAAL